MPGGGGGGGGKTRDEGGRGLLDERQGAAWKMPDAKGKEAGKNTVIKYPVGRSNAHRAREIAAGSFAFFGPLDCAPLVTFLL